MSDSRSPQPPPSAKSPAAAAADDESTYIDYETFLAPSFSPYTFAHTLVQSTHDASDTTLTLTTPLSRVLFDLQEIDTHIHNLTSSSALPLLTYTSSATALTSSTVSAIESQLDTLSATYARLQSSITAKSTSATAVLTATENLHATTTALRDIARALVAARQLDQNLTDNALLRAAQALRDLREALPESSSSTSSTPQPRIVTELRTLILQPGEAEVSKRATEQLLDGGALALYVISPSLCSNAVRDSLRGSMQNAAAALLRALTSVTLLDRAVGEVVVIRNGVTRLQESLLEAGLKDIVDGIVDGGAGDLRTVFFGGVAEGVEAGVQDVVRRGGANARILKGARDKVRQAMRACVERDWEGGKGGFESAVMVGAAAALGR